MLPVVHCSLTLYTACAQCTCQCTEILQFMGIVLCSYPVCKCSELRSALYTSSGAYCTAGALISQEQCTAPAPFAPAMHCCARTLLQPAIFLHRNALTVQKNACVAHGFSEKLRITAIILAQKCASAATHHASSD